MADSQTKLRNLLRELFQLDSADLDFGIYRIMNTKRSEIERFLDNDLLPQIKDAFLQYKSSDSAQTKADLDKLNQQLKDAGIDPDLSPKVNELREKLSAGVDVSALENQVFSDLFNFFRRYYDEGDFLSLRRYKEGVYAIPYEGEEVKLYWANHDQYYIKSSEYLRDYTFRVADGRRVHLRLASADAEKDNNKSANGNDRRFILVAEDAIAEENGELEIRFEFRPDTEKRRQDTLNAHAAKAILESPASAAWLFALAAPDPSEADPNRTVLAKHLKDYTRRNTSDYFIHKDVGPFLRRELDFFIKNEVMHLDDIENSSVPRVEQYLSRIKVLRRIAHKIIDFVAQLENFQKKLWLKRKFVVEVNYCITLDRVPESMYAEIADNNAQREDWVKLFAIDDIMGDLATPQYSAPLTVDFLQANKNLPLDTRYFTLDFRDRILSSISSVDGECDGLLVRADNFQALRLLMARYKSEITCIYIDPPYNSDAGPISYKNGYRHSSWIALLDERLRLARRFLDDKGILCITIDDYEAHHLRALCDSILSGCELLGVAPIKNNPAGRTGTVGFSVCHEYAFFYGMTGGAKVDRLEHNEAQIARYKESDEIGNFEWTNFRKHGGLNTFKDARPRQFYPIYVHNSVIRIPRMTWDDSARRYVVHELPTPEEETLWPIDEKGRERIWDFIIQTAVKNLPHFLVRKDSKGETAIYRKWRINQDGLLPKTWWDKSEYSAAEYGTNLLTKMFGSAHSFMFPKSLHAVADCLKVSGLRNDQEGTALDFFAGSGTTGHAIITLNRDDGGSRKYVLVESGDYVEEVTLARLKKAVYSREWKDGKPTSRATGVSHCTKYIRLESYEDALNNLDLIRSQAQQTLLDANRDAREDYTLRYMLDVESKGQSLLNARAFVDPFKYTLDISTSTVGETRRTNVDLVETFNYLLGLQVNHIDTIRGIRVVKAVNPQGEKVLVIWRNVEENPNSKLDEFFQKQGYNTKDMEFDLIYVNGDNNLENLKKDEEAWKVRLIEEEFARLMFDVQDA